jgi:N-acetylneuraminic acid mutarotase
MQGSMIICLFSCLIHAISCWSFQADLSSMLVSSLPHNLTGFSTAYNSLLNQLVIYSGTSNGTYSTTTYVFNLTDYSLKKIEQAVDEVRYKASILAHQNQLYLFGGHKINSTSQVDSGEFWKLDLVTFEWKNIESQL